MANQFAYHKINLLSNRFFFKRNVISVKEVAYITEKPAIKYKQKQV